MAFSVFRNDISRGCIRGVLFDMDGVILDTEKLYARFWMEGANDLGYPMTWEQALGMRSLSNTAGQAKLESYFGKGVSRESIRKRRIERMEAYIREHGVEAKPGVRELLSYLKERGIPAAITTSSPMERVQSYLSALDLLDGFTCLCSGHDVPRGKPEPDIYLYGARSLGFSPEECLAVEDSFAGLLSAHRAGCLPVMVPDLDGPDAEGRKLLFALADTLEDLIGLLEVLK